LTQVLLKTNPAWHHKPNVLTQVLLKTNPFYYYSMKSTLLQLMIQLFLLREGKIIQYNKLFGLVNQLGYDDWWSMSFNDLVVCCLSLVSAHALCGCLNTSRCSGYELDHQLGLQSCSITVVYGL
jgi:hypothetical protein